MWPADGVIVKSWKPQDRLSVERGVHGESASEGEVQTEAAGDSGFLGGLDGP